MILDKDTSIKYWNSFEELLAKLEQARQVIVESQSHFQNPGVELTQNYTDNQIHTLLKSKLPEILYSLDEQAQKIRVDIHHMFVTGGSIHLVTKDDWNDVITTMIDKELDQYSENDALKNRVFEFLSRINDALSEIEYQRSVNVGSVDMSEVERILRGEK